MIDNPHQQAAFTIGMTRDRVQESLGQFLDEDDVKAGVCFKDCADNEIVFLDILQKNLKVFQNHRLFVFPVERIEFFLISWSLAYSFVCYSLLKQCFQNRQSFELA